MPRCLEQIPCIAIRNDGADIFGAKAANIGELMSIAHDYEFKVPWAIVIPEGVEPDLVENFCSSDKIIVRSSFVGEDSRSDSMAGKFKSVVTTVAGVKEAMEEVFASGSKLLRKNVVIQEYIEAKYSGEYFTYNPDNGGDPTIWNSIKGNGGTVDGTTTIINKLKTPERFSNLNDGLVVHFGRHLDIEWVIDKHDVLWIVQARPITKVANRKEEILYGLGVLNEFASGIAVVVNNPDNWNHLRLRSNPYVLVAPHTNRKWEHLMKKAAGLITDHGTNTCHAAIFSREIDLPAVIGTLNATKKIQTGDRVYINTLTNPGYGTVYREII